jgi:hypothetical protein
LANKLVQLHVVEGISDETVRRVLKKTRLLPWLKEEWCIPKVGAEFVWRMEDLLDLYMQPYDEASPVVCDFRTPLPIDWASPAARTTTTRSACARGYRVFAPWGLQHLPDV